MRQTHGPAEKLFVDFAGDTVPVFDATTGTERRAHVFVAVLGASNYTYAEARWSEGLADWIGAHVNALNTIGGVPKAVVCDNLKAGVTAACRYEPGINRTYQEFAEHYDTAILPTRPRKPRDKAKVEVAVQIVQRFVLARLRNRRFFSLYELNAAIRETVADLNAKIMRKLGVSRDELFAEIDRPALKALPATPISLPSGRSVGPRPTTTLRSPITITPCRRASSASNSRHASPTPRSRSCTKASVWRAMPVLMRAVGTQRFPSTCRARTGATPSGRRPG
jgi:hypothetical protein